MGVLVSSSFLRNVVLKSLVLFLLLDLALAAVSPSGLGRISLYNQLLAGRLRFPFGENPAQAYNLSIYNLDAMFASHVLAAGPKLADEYRVIVIGDSSTWGTLLHPQQTLAGQLDTAGLVLCGKRVRVYNLGYPTISLTKDLMVLDYAMRYQPDLVIWPVTLEAFPLDKQLTSPIVANNATRIDDLAIRYNLPFDANDTALVRLDLWDRTLIGQRRALADLFRLQMYGVLWSATGIDQTYPSDYEPAQTDFNNDITFHGLQSPPLDPAKLAFEVLEAGLKAAGKLPVLLINEPMLISDGKNSAIRYNFFYPRWAYDQWRQMMTEKAAEQGWDYLDLWDLVPADQFTNSAIHLTPAGEAMLASSVEKTILKQSCP
jgi:hypothetical protein